MKFKLKCKSCGNIIIYDTDEESAEFKKCSSEWCDNSMNLSIESKLNAIAGLEEFELVGTETSFNAELIREAFEQIDIAFCKANEEDKTRIANIVDKLFLLLNEKNAEYEEIKNLLDSYFFEHCEKRNQEYYKELESE